MLIENPEENILRWRKRYNKALQKDRISQIKRTILVVVGLVIMALFIRLWANEELQFIGYETSFSTGVVVEIRNVLFGQRHFKQRVFYEFEHDGTTFRGSFLAGQLIGKQEVVKRIKVKFAVSDPRRSKMEAIYTLR